MTTLFRSIRSITINNISSIVRVSTDGELLYFTVGPAIGASVSNNLKYSMSVGYGTEAKTLESTTPVDTTISFAYGTSKSITVGNTAISVNGGSTANSYTFTWERDADSLNIPDPTVEYSISGGVRVMNTTTIDFNFSDLLSRNMKLIGISCVYLTNVAGVYKTMQCTSTVTDSGYQCKNYMVSNKFVEGNTIKYRIEVACYANEAESLIDSGERFIGYTDFFTPTYILSGCYSESTPYDLVYETPVAGARLQVAWSALSDSTSFELERSVDGADWALVYSGSSLSFTDRVGDNWSTVAYRVKAEDSPWWVGDTLNVLQSNLYVGTSNGIKTVSLMYLGDSGEMRAISPIMSVGGM